MSRNLKQGVGSHTQHHWFCQENFLVFQNYEDAWPKDAHSS
jgi:hypothetical protein